MIADNLPSRVRLAREWMGFPSARFERNVIIKGNGRVDGLTLGAGVVVQSGTVIHVGGQAWCKHLGSVEIGDGGGISPNCVLYGAGPGGIKIGKRFDCGPNVGIYSSRSPHLATETDHVFSPASAGDDVIVFSNVVIGPGVAIGDRAVVAAGAVVLDDVPAGSLVGGTPAKVLPSGVR